MWDRKLTTRERASVLAYAQLKYALGGSGGLSSWANIPLTNIATDDFTVDATPDRIYVSDLRRADELKQSVFSPPDRVNAEVQNVDKVFGAHVQDEVFANSEAIVGRYFRDPAGVLPPVWVELFRGEARPTALDEKLAKLEILHDLAAAGYCVGDWSLAENCQFQFKQTDTCGYAGGETICNKKRKSLAGCLGRTNEARFGGMEFPDVQVPTVPTGGDPEPPEPPYCPRVDQYVLVRDEDGKPESRGVSFITDRDMLFHPIKGTFHRVRSATIIREQKIWRMFAENGAESFSSHTHRVLSGLGDGIGSRVDLFNRGDDVLTYTGELNDSRVATVHDTGEIDDVVKIEMEDGHIYCAGDDGVTFIVCHNAKPAP